MKEEKIDSYYKMIKGMKVSISPDPIPLGPNAIHENLSKCRKYIGKVEEAILHVNQEKSEVSKKLRAKRSEFKIEKDNLLINDPEVKDYKGTIAEKMALADHKLIKLSKEIVSLEAEESRLVALLETLKLKDKNLNRLNSDIRLQWSIMQSQIYHLKEDPQTVEEKKIDEEEIFVDSGKDQVEIEESEPEEESITEKELEEELEKESLESPVDLGKEEIEEIPEGEVAEEVENLGDDEEEESSEEIDIDDLLEQFS